MRNACGIERMRSAIAPSDRNTAAHRAEIRPGEWTRCRTFPAVWMLMVALLGAGCASLQRPAVRDEDRFLFEPPRAEREIAQPSVPPEPQDEAALPPLEPQIPPLPEEKGELRLPYRETGVASWYLEADGHRTASGERFNRYSYAAAHRTLPFGTVVLVRNLDTERDVVVRITDRGPFVEGRIIDLTEAAARRIGLYRSGLARVEIQVLQWPPGATEGE